MPSPTFTLLQVYDSVIKDGAKFPIVHADLFRIKEPSELAELGWDEAADGALVIVEWPERAGGGLSGDRLDIAFRTDTTKPVGYRLGAVTGVGSFGTRLALSRSVRALLEKGDFVGAERTFMMGDASTRAYERLLKPNGTKAILMISPPRPDGPPIRYGKPYSAIARLAEDIRPFLAVDGALRAMGFSAPAIYAHDTQTGLAIIEDLGAELLVHDDGIIPERYAEAVAVLARLHGQPTPATLPDGDGGTYVVPPYDAEALLIEVELLPEWYAPHVAKTMVASGAKAGFVNLWREAITDVIAAPPVLTLRELPFAQPHLAVAARGSEPRRHHRLSGRGSGPPGLRRRLAAAGRARQRPARTRAAAARSLRQAAKGCGSGLRHGCLRQGLRHTRRAARDQDPGYLRTARQAGPLTAIPRSPAASTSVSAQESRASGIGGDQVVGRAERAEHSGDAALTAAAVTQPTRPALHAVSSIPHTAMVFAAGLGTRMRPVTDTMPKPLVPVGGKPLIDHMLDRFAEIGLKRAIVNVHYFADQIEAHLAHRASPKIVVSDERARLLDQAGGIRKVLPLIGDDPFFYATPTPSGSKVRDPTSPRSPRVGTRQSWTCCSSSPPPRPPSVSTGRATSLWRPTVGCTGARSVPWPPSSTPESAS